MEKHLESEKSVLGAMLRSTSAVSRAVERLQALDFSTAAHREIFSDMAAISLSGQAVDLTTLDAELTRRGKLDAVGGPQYLVELSRSVPSARNVDAYIDTVLEAANTRRLQKIAESINRAVSSGDKTADSIIEAIDHACNDITTRNEQQGGGWINGMEGVMMAFEAAEHDEKRIPTGFEELDDMLCGGLVKSELTIVGARPGKGKSSFMLAAALAAARAGYKVGFISLEMSEIQMFQRVLASASMVGISKQRRGKNAMTEEDWAAMASGMERLGDQGIANFRMCKGYGMTLERLISLARHAKQRGELDLLVIDYIQLMRTAEKTSSDVERLGRVSQGLKQLALQLDIPILTAAQVRRQGAGERSGSRAPTLDELRGSGDLEQDADNVFLIHSPDDPDDSTLKGLHGKHEGIYERALFKGMVPFTLEVAKQRQGPTGRTWCLFAPMVMRFFDDKESVQSA